MIQQVPGFFRVAAGATYSPMALHQGDAAAGVCPWCRSSPGTWNHICWQCNSPRWAARPRVAPMDALQSRLGWPTSVKARKEKDLQLARWVVEVDRAIREDRHGTTHSSHH